MKYDHDNCHRIAAFVQKDPRCAMAQSRHAFSMKWRRNFSRITRSRLNARWAVALVVDWRLCSIQKLLQSLWPPLHYLGLVRSKTSAWDSVIYFDFLIVIKMPPNNKVQK
eukprot:PhM_4_TR18829/c2_g2_i4/m.95958